MFHLIVRDAFGPYHTGERIEDAAEVKKVLGSENEARVLRVLAPEPASAPAPAPVVAAAEPAPAVEHPAE